MESSKDKMLATDNQTSEPKLKIAETLTYNTYIHNYSIVVVEGKSDKKAYTKFLTDDKYKLRIIIGGNKPKALELGKRVEEHKINRLLVIVDADFDWLNEVEHPDYVLLTDTRDMESMIICSEAFKDFFTELRDEYKEDESADKDFFIEVRDQYEEGEYADTLREHIIDIAAHIGYFQWIIDSSKQTIETKDIANHNDILKNKIENEILFLELNIEQMIEKTCNNSCNWHSKESKKNLTAEITEFKSSFSQEIKLLARGHTCVQILHKWITYVVQKSTDTHLKIQIAKHYKKGGIERLQSNLRQVFGVNHFAKTNLCKAIAAKEKALGIVILKEDVRKLLSVDS